MMGIKKTILAGLGAIALSFSVIGSASAGLMMIVLDPDTLETVTVLDGGAKDSDATSGSIVYLGGSDFTNWSFVLETGLSDPIIGSKTAPRLDLLSVQVTSSGAGQLLIFFSDTDFISNGGTMEFVSSIGGTTDGSVNFGTCIFTGNTNMIDNACSGGSFLTLELGITGDPSFAFTEWSSFDLSGTNLFGLGVGARVIHTASGQITSFDALLEVPEPAVLGFLGLGFLGLGIAARRRRKA